MFCLSGTALLLALASCGSTQLNPRVTIDDAPLPRSPLDTVVSNAAIRRAGPNSPGGVVLRWWQALQYGERDVVSASYASRQRETREKVRLLRSQAVTTRMSVLRTDISGEAATVQTALDGYLFYPEYRAFESLIAFRLLRTRAGWRLADDRFLDARLQVQLAAAQSHAKS